MLASLHTYAEVGGMDAQLIGETNAVAVLGFGHRFELPMDFSLDVGATVRFNYLAYSEAIGKDTLLDMFGDGSEDFKIEDALTGVSLMAGWSLPIDVGVNLNMPYGFSFGVPVRKPITPCDSSMHRFYANSVPRFSVAKHCNTSNARAFSSARPAKRSAYFSRIFVHCSSISAAIFAPCASAFA